MTKIAVVTPLFPLPTYPHRGLPIYQTVLQMVPYVELKAFCPLGDYPKWLPRPIAATSLPSPDYNPPGIATDYFVYPAVPVLSRPVNGALNTPLIKKHLAAYQPDLVLAYWLYPEGYGAVRASKELGIPVIAGARGSDLHWETDPICRLLVKKTMQQADLVLTVSEEMRRLAMGYGIDGTHVHTILNGCDSSIFYYRDQQEACAALQIPPGTRNILFVGRLTVAKGFTDLLEALSILVRQDPAIHLYCIGENRFRNGLRRMTERLGVESHVHHLGFKNSSEIAEWMAACDVMCLPSHAEGCPNVVVEAISSGTPVVATDVGGIPELVTPDNGILVPAHRPTALAEALQAALKRTWDRPANARQSTRGWDMVAKETLQVCESVLARKSRPLKQTNGAAASAFATPSATPTRASQSQSSLSTNRDGIGLIINADDLGISSEVNEAIFDFANRGLITSATILANGPGVQKAIHQLSHFPTISFGVHLNCTQFQPFTKSPSLAPLLDSEGRMSNVIRNIPFPVSLIQAIYDEWSAQISSLLHAGVRISHFDSHHHSHTVPKLLFVMRALRQRFGISKARISTNIFAPGEHKALAMRLKKRGFNAALRTYGGFQTPDGCTTFETLLSVDSAELKRYRAIEAVVHPGHLGFANETRLLETSWRTDVPLRKINFEQL